MSNVILLIPRETYASFFFTFDAIPEFDNKNRHDFYRSVVMKMVMDFLLKNDLEEGDPLPHYCSRRYTPIKHIHNYAIHLPFNKGEAKLVKQWLVKAHFIEEDHQALGMFKLFQTAIEWHGLRGFPIHPEFPDEVTDSGVVAFIPDYASYFLISIKDEGAGEFMPCPPVPMGY